MKDIDLSYFLHAAISIGIQLFFGLLFGFWFMGGVAGVMIFVGREITQAEYRWIAKFGGGKRSNMPRLAGFYPRVWDLGSVLDLVAPLIGVSIVWYLSTLF